MKKLLTDFSLSELEGILSELGEPKFRAKQLYIGILSGKTLTEFSNLPNGLKDKLQELYAVETTRIAKVLTAKDGTEKMLFVLPDNQIVEGVFMRYRYGNTLCVSTQVGCRMNCSFCASGLDGLIRNLSAGEMLGQVIAVNRHAEGGLGDKRAVTNLVLMGSGEPLDNYDQTVKFLRLVSAEGGLNISPRNISLSTCGLVPEMMQFADEGLQVNLTVSLHATDDERRSSLMPINKRYPIAEVIKAAKHYFNKTKRRIIFEYSLIKGENCDEKSARALVDLLRGLPCHVNLIQLNYVKERGKMAAKQPEAAEFLKILTDGGLSATLRRSMGAEIEGACGQLRRRYLSEIEQNE